MNKLITIAIISSATLLYAQQRRQHMVCPIDGAQMSWTGNQKAAWPHDSCEFSHVAYENNKRTDHKAWASCVEP